MQGHDEEEDEEDEGDELDEEKDDAVSAVSVFERYTRVRRDRESARVYSHVETVSVESSSVCVGSHVSPLNEVIVDCVKITSVKLIISFHLCRLLLCLSVRPIATRTKICLGVLEMKARRRRSN
jgi:hypothetical protein